MSYRFFELDTQYELIKDNLKKSFDRLLDHKQFINGPEVLELEQKIEKFFPSSTVFATTSGTSALTLALMALDLEPEEEVIASPVSFGATATSIVLAGGTPVFVDIDETTGLIDINSIEKAISSKTRVILPVSLYGQPVDSDEINQIANKYNLKVIEDACQSFGATYKSFKSGSLANFSTFSFFPAKTLGSYGNAGCILINDGEYVEKIRMIRQNGQSKRFTHEVLGFNALMNSFQAVTLLEKLKLFDKEWDMRQKLASLYDKTLESLSPKLDYIRVKPDRISSRAYYVIKSSQRNKLMDFFTQKGYPLTIHYPIALFDQPFLKGRCKVFGNPDKTRQFVSEIISLPLHAYFPKKDQEKIIQLLKDFIC